MLRSSTEPSIPTKPSLQPERRRRHRRSVSLLLAVLLLAIVAGVRMYGAQTQRETLAQPPDSEFQVEAVMARYRARIQRNPDDTAAYAELGLALLQKVRNTNDPVLYQQAEDALDEAIARDPEHLEALIGQGMLALSRHRFQDALVWAERAGALNPFRAQILGIRVDAYVELGRYPEAVAAAQEMIDLRPDLHSYSRVSYLRELHGDLAGARAAMQAAAAAGTPGAEPTLWSLVQLGHLYFREGDLDAAEQIYQDALHQQPGYLHAQAGLARVQAARGKINAAIATYAKIVERLPLPEYVVALGELYEANGEYDEAAAQYAVVRVIYQLNAAAGMDVALEQALFEADHGDPALAEQLARAAYARRPTILAADALAWALFNNGKPEEAWPYNQEALRLGTQDAWLHWHARMVARALGNEAAAHMHLQAGAQLGPRLGGRF